MVAISCSGKFHAFNLAEELHRHDMLGSLLTTYAYAKNTSMRTFAKRIDREEIPISLITTCFPLAIAMKIYPKPGIWNPLFDKWASRWLEQHPHLFKVYIGWSGMALSSIKVAKRQGKPTIVERGSAHILVQDKLLREEYAKFGIRFKIDPAVIERELEEYEEADYIAIPSRFVQNTFIDNGISEHKLLINPYGTSALFNPKKVTSTKGRPLRILYLGTLSIQKGVLYLMHAITELQKEHSIEAIFIGSIEGKFKPVVDLFRKQNPGWKFTGHINHYELPKYIQNCDIGVVPSIQDGFAMVIPQILSCGIPVIASVNSGGPDIIEDGNTGFLVPIRSAEAIADRLHQLLEYPEKLDRMQIALRNQHCQFSWQDYGDRYAETIKNLLA